MVFLKKKYVGADGETFENFVECRWPPARAFRQAPGCKQVDTYGR